MPNSHFMFHQGTFGIEGTIKQVDSMWEFNKLADTTTLDIYEDVMKTAPNGKCRHWSRKRIREWLIDQMNRKEDIYLTAEDAVKWGFADEIFEGWDIVRDYTPEQRLRK